jgi:hypothetical protein
MQTSGPKQTPQVIYVRYRWLGMRAIPARNVVTRRPNCEIPLDEEISRVCDGLVRVRDTRAFQRRISTGTTLFLRRGYVETARCEGTEQPKTQTDTTQQHSPVEPGKQSAKPAPIPRKQHDHRTYNDDVPNRRGKQAQQRQKSSANQHDQIPKAKLMVSYLP